MPHNFLTGPTTKTCQVITLLHVYELILIYQYSGDNVYGAVIMIQSLQ